MGIDSYNFQWQIPISLEDIISYRSRGVIVVVEMAMFCF